MFQIFHTPRSSDLAEDEKNKKQTTKNKKLTKTKNKSKKKNKKQNQKNKTKKTKKKTKKKVACIQMAIYFVIQEPSLFNHNLSIYLSIYLQTVFIYLPMQLDSFLVIFQELWEIQVFYTPSCR